MTKEELKALGLTEEQVTKVVEDYGKNYVAKNQFNQKNEEVKQLKTEKEKITSDLDALKEQHKSDSELVEQLNALKEEQTNREKQHKKELDALKLSGAVELALTNAKAKNTQIAKSALQLDKLIIADDGSIVGLDEQIKALKTSDPYLFGESGIKSPKPGDRGDGDTKTVTKEDFQKMTLLERQDLYMNDKETYEELTKGE